MPSLPEITTETGFHYVAGMDARVLILGSMPSSASLGAAQYYAHPRNAFWPIMGALCRFEVSMAYDQKLVQLKQNKIALWDVVHRCQRPGSLDSNILADTVVENDFRAFFAIHKQIHTIFFNGKTAAGLFRRHVLPHLESPWRELPRLILPSTSPTHAALSFNEKLSIWKQVRDSICHQELGT